MDSKEYIGIYGVGEEDARGNLYLRIDLDLMLTREKNHDGTYNIIAIETSGDEVQGICLEENANLRRWREIFLEINSKTGRNKLDRLIMQSVYSEC